MAIFNYLVKNESGQNIKGKVEASDQETASNILRDKGLLVIKIVATEDGSFASLKSFFGGVKYTDLVSFTRQLATMINAGLPLATCLSILEESSKEAMARMVASLLKEIEDGNTFSKALQKNAHAFSRVYIQLVRAGEIGGVLDKVLNRLAETMEKEKEFKAKTKGAMIYPVIVLIAMVVVAFIMMIFVVPKMVDMYREFGGELPLATKLLMWTSDFMVKFWWLIILLFVGGGSGLRAYYKTEKGELNIDRLIFKVPIVGDLRKKIILTDFARTLALLLGTGVSLLEALDIVAEAMPSIIYRKSFKKATKQVEKGSSLSQAISGQDIFPPILHQMMSVGEETGKIDDVLMKLSVYFESESEHAVKNLTTAMEPMIMIVLAIGVGIMVMAIIMPIYNLTSQF
ncbi:MAG: type II secretion system F family protein [Candidatus Woesebacteria bacterium]|jgi:type IV pilus assembly protein PilC